MNDIFERYKTYKKYVEGRSDSTLNQYYLRFSEYVNDMGLDTEEKIINANVNIVKEWLVKLAERENGERTRNIKLSAIKEIYRFLGEQEEKNIDFKILHISFAKVPQRENKYIDSSDKGDFLGSITNLMIKTATAICIETGMRFCELMQITTKGIENGKQMVIGKGNKERPIYFKPYVIEIANKYISRVRDKIVIKNNIDDDTLLLTRKGKPLTRQEFTRSLKFYGKRFNENPLTKGRMEWWNELSPHKLRHTFATGEFERGVDAPTVQRMLGHSNMATTSRYSHSNEDRVRKAMLGEEK